MNMKQTKRSEQLIEQTETFSAHNYRPLPVVIEHAEGCWVTDVDGKRYLDFLSAYSAMNHGHRHPRILAALQRQLERVTLTSRAFYNDQLGPLSQKLAELSGLGRSLPMNTGAEAVETALKLVRKWGYAVKKVPRHQAEIIVCENNFHGRTISIISFSSEADYKDDFGPFTPGFRTIPYGDAQALEAAITPNTVAFLVEPIQGEGGIFLPPKGYLKEAREICDRHNVLLVTDEIQTGLGRTGKMFCYQHDEITPDVVILGKALGGGVYPISMVLAHDELMLLFAPGQHGSTFGGNPLACAVAQEALDILIEEQLPERAMELGEAFKARLQEIDSPHILEVRGKGLMIGIEIKEGHGGAKPFCKAMMHEGLLCKETHDRVLRFSPPLTVTQEELDIAFDRIQRCLT